MKTNTISTLYLCNKNITGCSSFPTPLMLFSVTKYCWWFVQACTEMVMPMSSNPNNSMFPPYNWDLGAFEQWCMETFHVKPRSTWITTEYGGKVDKHYSLDAVVLQFACSVLKCDTFVTFVILCQCDVLQNIGTRYSFSSRCHEVLTLAWFTMMSNVICYQKKPRNVKFEHIMAQLLKQLWSYMFLCFWIEVFCLQDIKAVLKNFGSNIVFSNGLLDPWSGGGWAYKLTHLLCRKRYPWSSSDCCWFSSVILYHESTLIFSTTMSFGVQAEYLKTSQAA